ncbi:endonuclease/exonuclease/phosphatase family protein [Meridianimarinicoccus roseus]|uniref:endonuclease/exonuclease/phosphatase family protein n=1 Tax=Meridianimarinicoccus roseus TaxID=2072018 RepID=UPI001EE6733C|nr:endonuclease/exonuclease/phosphatase family protein [Meridianimarinicoccus roseus]
MLHRLALLVFSALAACLPAAADSLRLMVYTVELDRRGPGLLLRDIQRGDPQAAAAARLVASLAPDVLVLLRFDYDAQLLALGAFADLISAEGTDLKHLFSLRPNSGLMTDVDLDGDGRLRGPRDAQGYGLFSGHNGMAILSRLPIDTAAVRDFSALRWADLPGAELPAMNAKPFPSAAAQSAQRLSSTGHWEVPLLLPGGERLNLLIYHATPPVFDGPEDRNGLRNRDETRFWSLLLDGALDTPLGLPPPTGPVVVMGNSNLDPAGGDGRRAAMAELLAHPGLQDPRPTSPGAAAGGFREPELAAADTVAWDAEGEPGNLRVDYVLPDARLTVTGAGVAWPAPDDPAAALLGEDGRGASRHRPVWVDIALPQGPPRFLDPSGGSG